MPEIEILHDQGVAGWVNGFSPFGLFTTDTRLIVTRWNLWLEDHSGRAHQEVIGAYLLDLYPDLITRKLDLYFTEALEGRNVILAQTIHHYLLPIKSVAGGDLPENMPQSAVISPLISNGEICGTIGYIEDVSERRVRENELMERVRAGERLIEELRAAMAQIKTLSGMLPICANCKKIRDDQGYWSQVESYISKHSDLSFSHGICPECAKKLYPEFYKVDGDLKPPVTSEDRKRGK